MHKNERNVFSAYYVLLLIVCAAISISCQGAGGGGGARNRGSGSGSDCVGIECLHMFLFCAAAVVGILIPTGICAWCYYKCNGRPKENNLTFVNSAESTSQQYTLVKNVFETGMWLGRYRQNWSWHGPHQLHLSFNPHSMAVNGSGCDDVGEFTIDGIFSDRTQRMGLTKFYKHGTGNPKQNFGHSVLIQLAFNAQLNQFEGKWYVQIEIQSRQFIVRYVPASKSLFRRVGRLQSDPNGPNDLKNIDIGNVNTNNNNRNTEPRYNLRPRN